MPAVPAHLKAVCLPALSGAWICCRAYDWKSGNRFQQYTSPIQPGSLESESGIFALTFDKCACTAVPTCCLSLERWFAASIISAHSRAPLGGKWTVALRAAAMSAAGRRKQRAMEQHQLEPWSSISCGVALA